MTSENGHAKPGPAAVTSGERGPNARGTEGVSILVPSFDGCIDAWTPFFHCFFKYWPDCPYPVYLGSNEATYSDARVSSITVGRDKGYCSNLKAMLRRLETRWVLLLVEDAFLAAPVRTSTVADLVQIATDRRAAHLQMHANRWAGRQFFLKSRDGAKVVDLPAGTPYRVSIGLGLWDREVLLQLLREGETAWQAERLGTIRSARFPHTFLDLAPDCVSNPPFRIVHGMIKGVWTREAVRMLNAEALTVHLGLRPVMRFQRHARLRCYVVLRYYGLLATARLFGPAAVLKLVSSRS